MDRLFDSPWTLRITSLLLAILLYFYVVSAQSATNNSEASTQTDIIANVPLEVYYDDENLFVSGLPKTVDVKIEGPATVVQQTKLLKDYKVFVDLNSLLIGEHSVTIKTENFSNKLKVEVDPKQVSVSIEEKITQEFRVDPEINSSLIAEDYTLKGMTANPQKVYITGAKSIIDSISYVKATVKPEEGVSESFTQDSNVIVLNRDLNKLDVSIEPSKVNVNVDIQQYSRELPVKIVQTGKPKDNVTVNQLTSDVSKITLYGPKAILDSMTEFAVEYDVSKLEQSSNEKVKVKLPDGVLKASIEEMTIKVDVTKEEEEVLDTDQTSSEEQGE